MVSEGRGKQKLVVNTEIFKDGNLCEDIKRQCTLLSWLIVKEFLTVGGVRGEVDSTGKFS